MLTTAMRKNSFNVIRIFYYMKIGMIRTGYYSFNKKKIFIKFDSDLEIINVIKYMCGSLSLLIRRDN